MMPKKKLFLLDAYAIIFRAYFAFVKNPRINSKGLDTSAIFGFTNTLIELIKKEKPTHIAVCFDRKKPTFRHEQYSEYKANRDVTPEGIIVAKPYIDRLLKALNIPILYKDGFEADDVIGTLSKKAEKEGFQVYMMTSDKDFAQLVSENIFMYRLGNKWNPTEIWGIKEVLEKFQIKKVCQVIDFLGMMGDSVDNIPGLPGVGKKTAQKFIEQYGSMEGLLDNTHEIKGKLRQKVEEAKDQGIMSKRLATIELNVPIKFKEDELKISNFNIDEIKELFEELEFKTILNRILSLKGLLNTSEIGIIRKDQDLQLEGQLDMFSLNNSAKEIIKQINKEYIISDNINDLYFKIQETGKFSFQILCDSFSNFNQTIIGFSFCYEKDKATFVPFSEEIITILRKLFNNKSIEKIGFDIKSQIKILNKYNISEIENFFDISIAHYLLEPDMRHDLETLSENYLSYPILNITEVLGKGKSRNRISDLTIDKQSFYCSELTDIQFQLNDIFLKQLHKLKLFDLFKKIEMPLVLVLSKMELEGITLDIEMLTQFSIILSKEVTTLESRIHNLSGSEFNIASPKQMGEVLFEKMKIVSKSKKLSQVSIRHQRKH